MKVAGTATLDAGVEKVWDALLSPEVLVRTIPGCERLEETGENSYSAVITAGVASIKGTYKGAVQLSDLKPHESLRMHAEGSGAPGTISVDVDVRFEPAEDGTTQISYEADAVVGGMIGGVGQRMLTSVSKRMAKEFFGSVNKVLAGEPVAAAAAPEAAAVAEGQPAAATATTAQPAAAGVVTAAPAASPDAFLKGVVTGAAIALLGVAVGAVAARRR
ncbi:carbon monoxide dehydrogenase subunit G [Aeromicrobium sp. YIM 150415]|uniref:SRPBCC family protein n=1 Tax=Aeromicrobium sp. YIM 150415 TaxID=2803912 RepID=UPI00196392F2|nr:carbon monoxide dehydrogenase subunit G [Aeromicrobium sp. YIM 150415]MBM9462476.1 carbon monoxide dehydrogenase subunit G [Aeromicrobium sp. YIM 150415]